MRSVLLAAAVLLAIAANAAAAEPVTLPGGPLSVSVGPLGQCQSSYAGTGNDFYPPTGALGDCGFFLGFPELGNPPFLQKKVFGFPGSRGPGLDSQYTALEQRPTTGTGSAADPYTQVTTFAVDDPTRTKEGDYALIEETTSYVDGQAQFTSTFDVENVTGQPPGDLPVPGLSPAPATALAFQAIYAGELTTGGSDLGTGVLLAGAQRLLGGQNEAAGVLGAFLEAPPPSPPWASYASGCWNAVPEPEGRCASASPSDRGIWAAVRAAASEAPVFDDDVDPNAIDDGAGVSWDNRVGKPLQPGERAIYSIIDRAEIPTALSVAPAAQTHTVGQTATISVTALDSAGVPYAGRPIVYTIGEANPKSGSVLTNSAGVATISYTGTAPGADAVQMFLDLAGSGARTSRDPAATASASWTIPPAPANSRFAVRSIHAGANGAITIVLVPVQDGTATAEATVPTATISRNAPTRKRVKCKRNQVEIGGECRPKTSLTGRVLASGRAGVTLKLTIEPSAAVQKALVAGRKVQLAAKLTYKSTLGGTPTARTFHFTVVKPKRHKRHH